MIQPTLVTDTGIVLHADPTRVITRLFIPGREAVGPGESRAAPVMERLLALDESEVEAAVRDLDERFSAHHPALHRLFDEHADLIIPGAVAGKPLSKARQLLIGASFTHEYAIEGTALCNPSAVLHPRFDANGDAAFVMSVRGMGEGHHSSIGFRTGSVSAGGAVTVDPPGPHPRTAPALPGGLNGSAYSVEFTNTTEISERVLWPHAPAERHGMEDARFVRFVHASGDVSYYATYTAYDGINVTQQLLETTDFTSFTASPVVGAAARGKGLALFPRMVGGRYAALSRSDRETNAVAFSDDVRRWTTAHTIQVPTRAWEILQLGNCGSPIETEAGWLVLTHGVGPMRTYALGALLLDLDDPRRVIARSDAPILAPGRGERGGYVPNVVYSCGAFAHHDTLVLPYGVADQRIAIATLSIEQLLSSLSR